MALSETAAGGAPHSSCSTVVVWIVPPSGFHTITLAGPHWLPPSPTSTSATLTPPTLTILSKKTS